MVLLRQTFFLESKWLFSEVPWHTRWGFPRVVLVVPPAMVRELDYAKADPRRQQTRRRRRSIQVLKVLRAYSAAGALTTPSRLRDGVDLLLLDHESRSNEEALDLALPDDRLIAAALDFRETLPDQHVIVVSDDLGPWHKARRYGLDRRELPLGERRPHPKAAAKVVSSEQVT